ncbi:hypothetical protein TIFTF001_009768 [Ficus carica]|uniref:Uncharacterized protein n=1 Tax=Ficus carica TaxID=3494 RepID=A0AA88A7G4_FICCA|nr:hypothetical protein TIFTF001_009768 [Ficus carica]
MRTLLLYLATSHRKMYCLAGIRRSVWSRARGDWIELGGVDILVELGVDGEWEVEEGVDGESVPVVVVEGPLLPSPSSSLV